MDWHNPSRIIFWTARGSVVCSGECNRRLEAPRALSPSLYTLRTVGSQAASRPLSLRLPAHWRPRGRSLSLSLHTLCGLCALSLSLCTSRLPGLPASPADANVDLADPAGVHLEVHGPSARSICTVHLHVCSLSVRTAHNAGSCGHVLCVSAALRSLCVLRMLTSCLAGRR